MYKGGLKLFDMTERDEKYYRIIEGAHKLFTNNGIRNVSMDDVARSLGMSKKTIYQYVENKTDLLKHILDFIMENVETKISEIENRDLNAIDVLLDMSKIVGEKIMKFNPVVSFELEKYFPSVFETYKTRKKQMMKEFIRKNIEKGIREGYYRSDLNSEVVAHLYFEKIEDLYKPDILEQENFTFEDLFKVMFENHIRGISNEKGIKYFEKQKDMLTFKV
jgi:AcrR family transcriptional regulator